MSPPMNYVAVETGPNPKGCVIWLHGLGADGYDFVPIVKELEQAGLPPTRFVFPHAPHMPVSINGGHVMRAWYDIKNVDLQRQEDAKGIQDSQHAINALIEMQIEAGFSPAHIVLAGFSQGGAIVYQTGLRSQHRLAGLVALSTYLPNQDSFDAERTAANQHTPILSAHGTQDPIVPLQRGQEAVELLKEKEYRVQWLTYPMAHSVCGEEVAEIAQFFLRVLYEDSTC